MLTQEQIDFFNENSFLRLEKAFSSEEVKELSDELNHVIETFCTPGPGWSGPWRKKYMTEGEDQKAQLIAIHELQHYSPAWARAILNHRLTASIADLIGPEVELHHVTLHTKAAEFGTPSG